MEALEIREAKLRPDHRALRSLQGSFLAQHLATGRIRERLGVAELAASRED